MGSCIARSWPKTSFCKSIEDGLWLGLPAWQQPGTNSQGN